MPAHKYYELTTNDRDFIKFYNKYRNINFPSQKFKKFIDEISEYFYYLNKPLDELDRDVQEVKNNQKDDEMFDIVPNGTFDDDSNKKTTIEKIQANYKKCQNIKGRKEIIVEKYCNFYCDVLADGLKGFLRQYAKNEATTNEDIKKETQKFVYDYSSMVRKVLDKTNTNNLENKSFNQEFKEYTDLHSGYLTQKDRFEKVIQKVSDLRYEKDDIAQTFKNKSTDEIVRNLSNIYLNNNNQNKPSYQSYISAAQALKEKYEKRGFFSKLFHPFDSNKEHVTYLKILNGAFDTFPDKNIKDVEQIKNGVEKDFANKKFLTEKSQQIIDSIKEINPEEAFNKQIMDEEYNKSQKEPNNRDNLQDQLKNDLENANQPKAEQKHNENSSELIEDRVQESLQNDLSEDNEYAFVTMGNKDLNTGKSLDDDVLEGESIQK